MTMDSLDARLVKITAELDRRRKTRQFFDLFPEFGALCRAGYVKHQAFFAAGKEYRERAIIAANRVGKTKGVGGYEMVCHLTGEYPFWWVGRRFNHPVDAWAGGDTGQTVRDILQNELIGTPGVPADFGTGLIPGALILKTTPRNGIPNAIETVFVRHKSGGVSILTFKTYDQGRKSWQGTAKHVVWFNEEPPPDVYAEGLLRTMTCNGIVMLTFTPLSGLSEVVLSFMPGGALPASGFYSDSPTKFIIGATWDDAPHLTEAAKAELWAALPPNQREARSKGIPSLGSGAIYPVDEATYTVDDFIIPPYWPRAYGFDVGWNNTAALWGAMDRESDTLYLYSGYKAGQVEPPIHATAIKARGNWIPGVIDPASRGRSQDAGNKLLDLYVANGLILSLADNAVEAGLYDVWTRLSTGRIKAFKSLKGFFEEIRLYRRDLKGAVVKVNDHYMDDLRYLVRSGIDVARVKPVTLDPGTIIHDERRTSAMAS